MKKKILSLALAVTMVTGCGEKEKEKNTSSATSDIRNTIQYGVTAYDNGYTYSTTENGEGMVYFIDRETLENSPLCAMPNCSHSTAECPAKEVGSCPVIHGDYIYYFKSDYGVEETTDGPEFYINSKLMRMKLNSSETETITEFHDAVPDTRDRFVVADNKLYFQADDMNPKKDEFGMIVYSNGGGSHYLCSIDLATGEYTNYGSIYDGDKDFESADSSSSAEIIGIIDNKLMLGYSFLEHEISDDELFEEGFLMADHFTIKNFEFDLDKKTIKPSENPVTFITDNDSYGYYDKENNRSIIHDNGTEHILDGVRVYSYSVLLNGKLWIYKDEPLWYDLSDKSEHEAKGYKEILTYSDGKYIVRTRGMNFKAVTEEELI